MGRVAAVLLLIRHGQAEGNAQGRVMGQTDLPLTEAGRGQAAALGAWLQARGIRFRAVYASDLRRAADTARILSAACGGPLLLRPELRELGRGSVEGRTHAEAAELRRLPGVAESFEREDAVALRLARAGAELRAAALEGPVAAVAHGGSISRLLRLYLGLPLAARPGESGFSLDNTGLTVLDFRAGRTTLLCCNALYHLPPDALRWAVR